MKEPTQEEMMNWLQLSPDNLNHARNLWGDCGATNMWLMELSKKVYMIEKAIIPAAEETRG